MNEPKTRLIGGKLWRWNEEKQGYDLEALAAKLSNTKPKSNEVRALDKGTKAKAGMLAKSGVCITRFSTGSLDEDNLYGSAKSLLDGLRQAGLIPGDSPKEIDLEVKQVKVNHRKEQGTEIMIYEQPKTGR